MAGANVRSLRDEAVAIAESAWRANPGDLAAVWDVPARDGKLHRVEFEHGTTSGKRVLRLNGKEILRKEWAFKLVGRELFSIGKTKCAVNIENLKAHGSFAYAYTLEVDGKPYQKFVEHVSQSLETWTTHVDGQPTRICLEKDTMEVWVNGQKVQTAGEFVDDGTETHFELGTHVACIKATSSGQRKTGVVYMLLIDHEQVHKSHVLDS